jgi:hypothetical protein
MKFNFFFKSFLFGFVVVFISCDKEFNEIGADLVDSDHYQFTRENFPVIAYNQSLGPVQTNNLPINALGYYNNPVFGKTKASFVTQLELGTINPKFYGFNGATPVSYIDSVYLHVPYFIKKTGINADGDSTYDVDGIDSLYGNKNGKIKLNVYKSNFFLRNLDPDAGLLEQQRYYSDQSSDFNGQIGSPNLNDGVISQNNGFQFKDTQIKFYKSDGTTVRERLEPGIYMDLNKDFFKQQIINAPDGKLADNTVFKDYFRGLYFKVDDHPDDLNSSALTLLNFAQGKIVIVYHGQSSTTDTSAPTRKTLTLNMRGNTVNLLENNYTTTYTGALAAANTTTGDSKLYLKGGQGSMAVIKLFNGDRNSGTPPQIGSSTDLRDMRSEKWLINEANLVFNIDAISMGTTTPEPNRIYLYDLNNKRPLIDYYFDGTTNPNPKFNKLIHSGIIQKVSADARGTKYKIRITNYIRNLVKYGGDANVENDSTNVKLGLVVTESIGTVANVKVKNPFPYMVMNPTTGVYETKNTKFIPAMSVVNPLGTVLYGSNTNVPEAQRLQLEIVYTKPD